MAIFIEGMTCRLCGKEMRKKAGQQIRSFRPFVSNTLDPLLIFHDASVHEKCFRSHPLAEEADRRVAEIGSATEVWPPVCSVCHQVVRWDDQFTFGHLVDSRSHPLYEYNYRFLHESCLPNLPELSEVIRLVEELDSSGTWEGPVLRNMLIELRGAVAATAQ